MELQVFKKYNEKMKKAQEDQQEINEMVMRNIVTKKSLKDNEKEEEVNKRNSKNYGLEAENENSSFEGTRIAKNKIATGRKRK